MSRLHPSSSCRVDSGSPGVVPRPPGLGVPCSTRLPLVHASGVRDIHMAPQRIAARKAFFALGTNVWTIARLWGQYA